MYRLFMIVAIESAQTKSVKLDEKYNPRALLKSVSLFATFYLLVNLDFKKKKKMKTLIPFSSFQ